MCVTSCFFMSCCVEGEVTPRHVIRIRLPSHHACYFLPHTKTHYLGSSFLRSSYKPTHNPSIEDSAEEEEEDSCTHSNPQRAPSSSSSAACHISPWFLRLRLSQQEAMGLCEGSLVLHHPKSVIVSSLDPTCVAHTHEASLST